MRIFPGERRASLSVRELAGFALGPRKRVGGHFGTWRAELGRDWHSSFQTETECFGIEEGEVCEEGISYHAEGDGLVEAWCPLVPGFMSSLGSQSGALHKEWHALPRCALNRLETG